MATPDSDEFFVGPEEFNDGARDEKGIIPRFYVEPAENATESAKVGYAVFEDVEWIEINRAGDRLNVWIGKVAEEHRKRFPKAYRRFKAGMEQSKIGVPLEEWPLITKSMVAQWKAVNILSVEDLADCTDDVLPRLGIDGTGWRVKAQAWLKQRKDSGASAKMAADGARQTAHIGRLEKTIEDLNAKLEMLMSDDPSFQKRKTLSVNRPVPAE